MFLVDQPSVGRLVVFRGFGNHAGLRDDGLAVQLEKLCEERIVGRGRHGDVKSQIRLANGAVLLNTFEKPGVTVENRLFLRW
ncbi:hypothetical protein D3C80_1963650 [compost metagenome]